MNVTLLKIKEIIRENKGSSYASQFEMISYLIELDKDSPTNRFTLADDIHPYHSFSTDIRIAAYVGGLLTNAELCGQGDPYNPLYRIYELATRVRLFSALHSGGVILEQLVNLDHRDAPDYVDAYFMKGKFLLEPGLTRTLLEEELEFIHREAPELINMWVNESVVAA